MLPRASQQGIPVMGRQYIETWSQRDSILKPARRCRAGQIAHGAQAHGVGHVVGRRALGRELASSTRGGQRPACAFMGRPCDRPWPLWGSGWLRVHSRTRLAKSPRPLLLPPEVDGVLPSLPPLSLLQAKRFRSSPGPSIAAGELEGQTVHFSLTWVTH